MTRRDPDPELALAARALARVLDLEAAELRADSPLGDLGADRLVVQGGALLGGEMNQGLLRARH